MSSVFTGLTDLSKKSYISTEPLSVDDEGLVTHVYSYSKSYNSATYTWSGLLSGINFTQAPYSAYNAAGVVFRETGKKLYAGANPGVDRYMVGVFIIDQDGNNVAGDLGQMFIDPNCSVFAQFNGQRPTYIPTAEDDVVGGLDYGNPVYTRGNITTTNGDIAAETGTVTAYGNVTTTNGNLVASSTTAGQGSLLLGAGALAAGVNNAIAVGATATADNQIIAAGGIVAAKPIRCSTVTTIAGTSGAIDVAAAIVNAQVLIVNVNGAITRAITNSVNAVPGQVIYFIIYGDNAASAVDFGSGFYSQSSGVFTVGANRVTMSFVSDGTNFNELSRSGALGV